MCPPQQWIPLLSLVPSALGLQGFVCTTRPFKKKLGFRSNKISGTKTVVYHVLKKANKVKGFT